MKVFGCAAFTYDHKSRSKIRAKANPAIYMCSDDYGTFNFEILSSRKVIYTRHATFDENSFPALYFGESRSSSDEANVYDQKYDDDSSDSNYIHLILDDHTVPYTAAVDSIIPNGILGEISKDVLIRLMLGLEESVIARTITVCESGATFMEEQ